MLPLVKRSDPWLIFKYLSKGLTHEAAVPVQTGVTRGWGPPGLGSSGGLRVSTLDYRETCVSPLPPPKDKATQVGEQG